MFVLFSSSPFHPLINRLNTADFLICFLIPYIFVLPTIFHNSKLLLFCMFPHIFSEYIIIGRTVVLLISYFVSFLIYFFLQTRSFKQPVTFAAFWVRVLIYFTGFLELVMFTPKWINSIICCTILSSISNFQPIDFSSFINQGFSRTVKLKKLVMFVIWDKTFYHCNILKNTSVSTWKCSLICTRDRYIYTWLLINISGRQRKFLFFQLLAIRMELVEYKWVNKLTARWQLYTNEISLASKIFIIPFIADITLF